MTSQHPPRTTSRRPAGNSFARWSAPALGAGLFASCATAGIIGGDQFFRRVSAFPVFLNTSVDSETSAEIVAAAKDGTLLVYTDAPAANVGFVDITDPAAPLAAGIVKLPGEPTSVTVVGDYALVAINTSRDFVNVSGQLLVIDVNTRDVLATLELGGQPDSIAVSPDQQFAAVAIENERDEDLGNGEPPQLPPGKLVIVDLLGAPPAWTTRVVELVGVPLLFPEDPEPEFVDINADNLAVISLQENNHIALVDLVSGLVVGSFPAGTVDLTGIDVVEDGIIDLSGALAGVPREPDAVAWISRTSFATANEGDLFGGSRGFSAFAKDGTVLFDAGNDLEHLAVRIGHYPEERSENKGNEPEAVEYAEIGGRRCLFVGSERSSFIAVYELDGVCVGDLDGDGAVDGADLGQLLAVWGMGGAEPIAADLTGDGVVNADDVGVLIAAWGPCSVTPRFVQALPAGLSPEGLLAIPERNLLVVASEVDDRAELVRATISIYQIGDTSTYPNIVSADRPDGTPIPWAALSGLAAETTGDEDTVYAVYDSFFVRSRIYAMDVGSTPAVITGETELKDANGLLASALAVLKAALPDTPQFDPSALVADDGSVNLDPEGVTVSMNGGFWVASEGAGNLVGGVSNPADQPFRSPNLLLCCDRDGSISDVALLPLDLTRDQFRFGFEGVASVEEEGVEILYVAFQRRWAGAGDPANRARIGRYDTSTGEWTFAYYPLEAPTSPNGGWVGLSELTHLGAGTFAVIERDNQAGPDARIKRVASFSIAGVRFQPDAAAPAFPLLAKTFDRDLIADGDYDAGVILEKLEGMALLADGRVIVVNDNDGVDGSSGETRIFDLGALFAAPSR
jgi:hypothetical protein